MAEIIDEPRPVWGDVDYWELRQLYEAHRWLRVRCLDPKCDALLLVEEFALWELVNDATADQ